MVVMVPSHDLNRSSKSDVSTSPQAAHPQPHPHWAPLPPAQAYALLPPPSHSPRYPPPPSPSSPSHAQPPPPPPLPHSRRRPSPSSPSPLLPQRRQPTSPRAASSLTRGALASPSSSPTPPPPSSPFPRFRVAASPLSTASHRLRRPLCPPSSPSPLIPPVARTARCRHRLHDGSSSFVPDVRRSRLRHHPSHSAPDVAGRIRRSRGRRPLVPGKRPCFLQVVLPPTRAEQRASEEARTRMQSSFWLAIFSFLYNQITCTSLQKAVIYGFNGPSVIMTCNYVELTTYYIYMYTNPDVWTLLIPKNYYFRQNGIVNPSSSWSIFSEASSVLSHGFYIYILSLPHVL